LATSLFDDTDLLIAQLIQFIHEPINLVIGSGDVPLQQFPVVLGFGLRNPLLFPAQEPAIGWFVPRWAGAVAVWGVVGYPLRSSG